MVRPILYTICQQDHYGRLMKMNCSNCDRKVKNINGWTHVDDHGATLVNTTCEKPSPVKSGVLYTFNSVELPKGFRSILAFIYVDMYFNYKALGGRELADVEV